MADDSVLIQHVIYQRTERPVGLRIWADGLVQHAAEDNSLPAPADHLDVDRELAWRDESRLSSDKIKAIREAIRNSGIFDLEPRLLINYCKEDPGTAIWIATLDGNTAQVVVFDPRPRRCAQLDSLEALINQVLAQP
ncbi:MAG: hypothetical protein ABI947_25095 [Chloroflexota bacterium]